MGTVEHDLPAVHDDVMAGRLGGWELVRRAGPDWIVRLVGTPASIEAARAGVGARLESR